MKLYKYLFAAVIMLLTSCHNTSRPQDKKADSTVRTLSPEDKKIKRENDIKEAVNNQKMIVGSWELVAVDSADIELKNERIMELPFIKVEFTKDLRITSFLRNNKKVTGTYEWMAQNREIVVTTENGEGHVLIKKVNENELISKEGEFKSYFKRIK
jgi:hypothetical protein